MKKIILSVLISQGYLIGMEQATSFENFENLPQDIQKLIIEQDLINTLQNIVTQKPADQVRNFLIHVDKKRTNKLFKDQLTKYIPDYTTNKPGESLIEWIVRNKLNNLFNLMIKRKGIKSRTARFFSLPLCNGRK